MMNSWQKIDPKNLHLMGTSKTVRGVTIELTISPFDIPQAIKGEYDKSQNRFVIKFKYLSNEVELIDDPEMTDPNVDILIGANSGRIYEILLDVREMGVDVVGLSLNHPKIVQEATEAIDLYASSHEDRQDYFELTKNVIAAQEVAHLNVGSI